MRRIREQLAPDSGVTVLPVRDRSELRRFLDVEWHLHRDDVAWVPPLRSEMAALLRLRRNAFFERAEGCLFLARRGRAMAGRVSVQVDALERREAALFGFYEAADEEVGAALVEAVAAFAREHGASELVGPAGFTAFEGAGMEGPAPPGFVAAGELVTWRRGA